MTVATSSNVSAATAAHGATALGPIAWLSLALMIVGAVNWGLVGIANFDLVAFIFGQGSVPSRAVYALVGLAGLYGIALAMRLGRKGA